MKGGDVIGLVAHALNLTNKDAAGWLQEMYCTGESTSTVQSQDSGQKLTVPRKPEGEAHSTSAAASARRESASASFDPEKFGKSLGYDDQVRALGISEENAALYRIGAKREKLFIPICPPDVIPACWAEFHDGKLRLPDKWLPDNVVRLKRPA
jgi:hypothetical protein